MRRCRSAGRPGTTPPRRSGTSTPTPATSTPGWSPRRCAGPDADGKSVPRSPLDHRRGLAGHHQPDRHPRQRRHPRAGDPGADRPGARAASSTGTLLIRSYQNVSNLELLPAAAAAARRPADRERGGRGRRLPGDRAAHRQHPVRRVGRAGHRASAASSGSRSRTCSARASGAGCSGSSAATSTTSISATPTRRSARAGSPAPLTPVQLPAEVHRRRPRPAEAARRQPPGRASRCSGPGTPGSTASYSYQRMTYERRLRRPAGAATAATSASAPPSAPRSSRDTRIGLPFPVAGDIDAPSAPRPTAAGSAAPATTTRSTSTVAGTRPARHAGRRRPDRQRGPVRARAHRQVGLRGRRSPARSSPSSTPWAASSTASRSAATRSSRSRPTASTRRAGGTSASPNSFGESYAAFTVEAGARHQPGALPQPVLRRGQRLPGSAGSTTRSGSSAASGIGAAVISPLGPLGLDVGYGLDKVDLQGRPDPGWKLHFRLGNFF